MHWVVCWRSEFMGYESFYCSQPKLICGSLIWVSIVGDSLRYAFGYHVSLEAGAAFAGGGGWLPVQNLKYVQSSCASEWHRSLV